MGLLQARQVQINKKEKRLLEKYANKKNVEKHYERRIKIIIMASEGYGNNDIAGKLSVRNATVRKWRNRWSLAYGELRRFETGINNKVVKNNELLKRMLAILSDKYRPGKPCEIKMSQKDEIVAMACRKPADYNLPFTHWSHQLLAKAVVNEKIINKISGRYVGVILKKMNYDRIKRNTGSIQT